MSAFEIMQKYKRTKVGQAVNAAIRAEIPGGSDVVELGTKYSTRAITAKNNPESATASPAEIYAEIYADLRRLRDVMGDEIARRYGLKTKLPQEGANDSTN